MEANRKVFHDAVHGAISLHPLCVNIIDTPQFQRLRHVKQLGGVYSVYPAASNNRFEHSIGVCHLAGELARALQSRQPELQINDKDVLCVEIAALCHDLGHGPFSHLWEDFMKKAGEDWAHEDQSVRMFDHLMAHLKKKLEGDESYTSLLPDDFKFIKEMINGIKIIGNQWTSEGRGREKAFLYEIVANKRTGVDVDKWDYFLRDGHALGIKVTFDYYRLIKFCRVETHNEITEIVFRDKEVSSLYDMFHARAVLHHKAYKHRVVKTIETMLVDAFLKAFKCTKICEHTKNSKDERKCTHTGEHKLCMIHVYQDPAAYTNVTDDVFYQILRMEGEDKDLKEAKQILENIMNRDLYKFIGNVSLSEAELEHMTKEKSKDTKKRLRELEKEFSKALMDPDPKRSKLSKDSKLSRDSKLSQDDLAILTIKQDYGMENENPISKIKFYRKGQNHASVSSAKVYPGLLEPKRFLEVNMAVLCKNYDETIRKEAKTAYDNLLMNKKKPVWIASNSDTQGTS